MNIKHHITKKMFGDLEWELPFIIKHIEKLKEEVKSNYNFLSSLAKDYLSVFHYEFLLKKDKHKDFIITSANLQLSYLQLKSTHGKEFPVDIDGTGTIMLKADENELPISGGEWERTYSFLANILRNNQALDFLFSLKKGTIVSYKVEDPYSKPDHIKLPYMFFEFLYSTGTTPDISFLENLQELMKKTQPLFPNPAGYNLKTGLFVDQNIINTTHSLFTNNEADFNTHLFAALEDHKAFWGHASLHRSCASLYRSYASLYRSYASLYNSYTSLHNLCTSLHNLCTHLHNLCTSLHNLCARLHNLCAGFHKPCTIGNFTNYCLIKSDEISIIVWGEK